MFLTKFIKKFLFLNLLILPILGYSQPSTNINIPEYPDLPHPTFSLSIIGTDLSNENARSNYFNFPQGKAPELIRLSAEERKTNFRDGNKLREINFNDFVLKTSLDGYQARSASLTQEQALANFYASIGTLAPKVHIEINPLKLAAGALGSITSIFSILSPSNWSNASAKYFQNESSKMACLAVINEQKMLASLYYLNLHQLKMQEAISLFYLSKMKYIIENIYQNIRLKQKEIDKSPEMKEQLKGLIDFYGLKKLIMSYNDLSTKTSKIGESIVEAEKQLSVLLAQDSKTSKTSKIDTIAPLMSFSLDSFPFSLGSKKLTIPSSEDETYDLVKQSILRSPEIASLKAARSAASCTYASEFLSVVSFNNGGSITVDVGADKIGSSLSKKIGVNMLDPAIARTESLIEGEIIGVVKELQAKEKTYNSTSAAVEQNRKELGDALSTLNFTDVNLEIPSSTFTAIKKFFGSLVSQELDRSNVLHSALAEKVKFDRYTNQEIELLQNNKIVQKICGIRPPEIKSQPSNGYEPTFNPITFPTPEYLEPR